MFKALGDCLTQLNIILNIVMAPENFMVGGSSVVISFLFVLGTKGRMQPAVMAPCMIGGSSVVISFLICSRYKWAHATSSYGA